MESGRRRLTRGTGDDMTLMVKGRLLDTLQPPNKSVDVSTPNIPDFQSVDYY